ncbi:MAG: hypothetical protein KKA65_04205 [Nanoarchaeota archaeon]|nr:hypothetical protein [Nanoarchaeota archaeon]MBU4242048.1 hypothetical protein [Nanoarchaeota archaeon]MBU4352139.1 hypothetical protein [Nanoarchaeota archaeon]MBU4456680.1 hypothetical protein [Nanoarchaeota archaeon]MCG2719188.1 hypothetical protein [Nanoarchaeota archaeon]
MLRVIFDTNIYGLLIEENNIEKINNSLSKDKEFIIYGFKPIRKELRQTSKTLKLGKIKQRNLLLCTYDELTKGKTLKFSREIYSLALNFYKKYREYGGIRNWKTTNIDVDFIIVACACYYKLDIVISNDTKTMLNPKSLKAYRAIALKEALRVPNFWKYNDLKRRYNF